MNWSWTYETTELKGTTLSHDNVWEGYVFGLYVILHVWDHAPLKERY